MKHIREQRVILGVLIWVGLVAGLIMVAQGVTQKAPDAVAQLGTYLTRQRRQIDLDSDYNLYLRVGDPVFLAGSDEVTPIGRVCEVTLDDNGYFATDVTIQMYGASPAITENDHFEFHFAPDSTEWLLRTVLHEKKQQEIRQLLEDAFLEHRAEILQAFEPVVRETLQEARGMLREDLQEALARREPQLKAIGDRYQQELVREELVPLFQDEIWPVIQEEGQPLVEQVSREIWAEVSVFSFGWRYLYDKSPLPGKNLTETRFRKFVQEKVQPIMQSHVDDFLDVQKRITSRIATNDKVKQTFTRSMQTIAEDPEVQQLVTEVLREVVVDNARLHQALVERWKAPQTQEALAMANSRLDPVIRQIGVAIFGNPKQGITPEFAKALRRRILHKDAKWLTLHLSEPADQRDLDREAPFPATLPVLLSDDDTSYPYAPARRDR